MKKIRSTSAAGATALAALCSALSAFPAAAQAPTIIYTVSGDWKASVFGDVGGLDKISAENFEIAEKEAGTVSLRSLNDRGKIASTSEGIAYYYREVSASADFELRATASVSSFARNNQVSFGIMLRDKVYMNEFVKADLGSYLALGPLGAANPTAQFVFQRTPDGLTRTGDIVKSQPPGPGTSYRISFKKTGDQYILSFGDEAPVAINGFPAFTGNARYIGLFTSRNTAVKFSELSFSAGERKLADLIVDGSLAKTRYRVGETLDLRGLRVSALWEGGATEELKAADYIVFGFDSAAAGEANLMISYGGAMKLLPYTVVPLVCTSLSVMAYPVKTEYYLGDTFDSSGLRVLAAYDEGYRVAEIGQDYYELRIAGELAAGQVFTKPGSARVTIGSIETAGTQTGFDVTVKPAKLLGISIGRPPAKTAYFVGEQIDLSGMTVIASYDDGSKPRLSRDEYQASNLDSKSPGSRTVYIEHKGKKANLPVTVKKRALLGLELASRPRTTYALGERFDPAGLALSLAYDNGDREDLAPAAYALDTSRVDFAKGGIYEAHILPKDKSIRALALPVAVRAASLPEWRSIRFGQSTSDGGNYIERMPDGAVRVVALEGAGKVATDHDGIAFYYTVLDAKADNFELSADIQVLAYAKEPHDGQESFGIMARDALGIAGNSGIAASNFAALGGFSGGTRNTNGTQLFVRTGVTSLDGAGSAGIQRAMIDYEKPAAATTYPAKPYRLTLAKTNSGFSGRLNGGEEFFFWEPELLGPMDDKIYVGFFAARLATIEVRNISLKVTAAAADAARLLPPPAKTDPRLDLLSLDKSPQLDYRLVLRSNVAGSLTVKKGKDVLVRDREIAADAELALPAALAEGGTTPFTVALVPDDRQLLSSYATLVRSILVTEKSYAPGADIRVSPAGKPDGAGTTESPLDLDTAIAFVAPGQRILVAAGTYERYKALIIPRFNDGKPGALKHLIAAPGSRPVLDFSKRSDGVILSGDFWRVEGIDVTNSAANFKGFTVGGNDNVVARCRFYGNGDTGMQISRTDILLVDKAKWPSRNLVLECESFDNVDPSENNADGFAAKLTSGEGNVFRGCSSHNNIDDGWDLYTKAGTGAIGAVLVEDCVAFDNGKTTKGMPGKGDKNGFKLGGEGVAVPHIVRNCLSYRNGAAGFTSNSNPAVVIERAFSYDNAGPNFSFGLYAGSVPAYKTKELFSFKSANGIKDSYPAAAPEAGGYLFDGSWSRNPIGWVLQRDGFMEALKAAGFKPEQLQK
jgi:hypothetical protein